MSKYFSIHPSNPQDRLLRQVIDILKSGGLVAVPTDCCYVICCQIGDKEAEQKIAAIKEYKDVHRLAILLPNLSMASQYAKIDNHAFRVMRSATPGAYTFILPAKKDIPKRLLEKRKNIGIRIPNNKILLSLLELYDLPLYSSTLWLPGDDFPLFEPHEIMDKLGHSLDAIVDGGEGIPSVTTIVSLVESGNIEIIREGSGDTAIL